MSPQPLMHGSRRAKPPVLSPRARTLLPLRHSLARNKPRQRSVVQKFPAEINLNTPSSVVLALPLRGERIPAWRRKVLESREKGRTPCVRFVADSHHVEHSHDVTASLRSVAAIVGRKLSLKGSCQSKHSLRRFSSIPRCLYRVGRQVELNRSGKSRGRHRSAR
jgi:hypothetical protein